jgi:NAD+ diphosphatase
MEEIVEAVWVTRAQLREMAMAGRVGLSPSISIARRIIENWYGEPIDQGVR